MWRRGKLDLTMGIRYLHQLFTSYIEVVSKPHLVPDGCVAIRFKMLTYCRVRSAFKPNRRLALEHNLRF
jgi:hypothetical protein